MEIKNFRLRLKYISGLTDAMLDYLSRSLVDDVEEDPDEIPVFTSKPTQADF